MHEELQGHRGTDKIVAQFEKQIKGNILPTKRESYSPQF